MKKNIHFKFHFIYLLSIFFTFSTITISSANDNVLGEQAVIDILEKHGLRGNLQTVDVDHYNIDQLHSLIQNARKAWLDNSRVRAKIVTHKNEKILACFRRPLDTTLINRAGTSQYVIRCAGELLQNTNPTISRSSQATLPTNLIVENIEDIHKPYYKSLSKGIAYQVLLSYEIKDPINYPGCATKEGLKNLINRHTAQTTGPAVPVVRGEFRTNVAPKSHKNAIFAACIPNTRESIGNRISVIVEPLTNEFEEKVKRENYPEIRFYRKSGESSSNNAKPCKKSLFEEGRDNSCSYEQPLSQPTTRIAR